MSHASDSTFHIIHPRGDMKKLKVLELSWSRSHELNHYSVASRREFQDRNSATDYAKSLARLHGQTFVPEDATDYYLD